MRLKAKHNQLPDEFLKPLNLTNDDLKTGLKLPLNAYTGTLRASFNELYDNLQGFSICSTGQLFILQLIHDLQEIPTLEMVSANTDAVMYTIEEEYQEQALKVLDDWQKLTGLELEEDKIVKIIMRDINNYVSVVQVNNDDYEVHYKGGEFRGKHEFKWDKEQKVFHYEFKDALANNSMTIVSEALLKKLLFDIPVEETINNCNDIFRFQMISHLGGTYEKCVQETPNGDIELQRNNRIYAGLKPSGTIIKVKPDGRRDSLADCPDNPIVDNANKCTIDMIDKKWYIRVARQKVEDFMGTNKKILKGRMKQMKKEELIEEVDRLNKLLEEKGTTPTTSCTEEHVKLLKKINELRKYVREYEFKLDMTMDEKHGGGDYSSINQLYDCIQEGCLAVGLDFSFECTDEIRFEREIMKPSVGSPRHLAEVRCIATLQDIDTGCSKEYVILGAGSDTIDKSLSGAETLAFRKWFTMNFTPKGRYDWDNDIPEEVSENETSREPKVPTYIPEKAKQEVKEEVVATEQHEDSDKEDIDKIVDTIMEIRSLMDDDSYAKAQLEELQKGVLGSPEILALKLVVENRLATLKGE